MSIPFTESLSLGHRMLLSQLLPIFIAFAIYPYNQYIFWSTRSRYKGCLFVIHWRSRNFLQDFVKVKHTWNLWQNFRCSDQTAAAMDSFLLARRLNWKSSKVVSTVAKSQWKMKWRKAKPIYPRFWSERDFSKLMQQTHRQLPPGLWVPVRCYSPVI